MEQIDFLNERVTVGKRKTDAGHGRAVPLNTSVLSALQMRASNFPERKPEHFVFAAERYGLAGDDERPHVHAFDPERSIGTLTVAWESAKRKSGVACRFHDLRHSACTRLVERGVPLPVIASLLGWSAGTTVRMARRYGHITVEAQRKAVSALVIERPSYGASQEKTHGQN